MTTTAFSILKLFNPIKVIINVYGHSISEVFFLEIFFDVDLWKKSLLFLLQYCFCFMFWFFGCEACVILGSNASC